MLNNKIKILNIKINREPLTVILNHIKALISDNKKFYVYVPNAYVAVRANSDPELLNIINNAEITIPDGMPLVWYSKTFKDKLPERIDGYRFFFEFSRIANQEGYSYYFLGAENEQILSRIKERLNKEFPQIIVKGFLSPPFMEKFPEDVNSLIVDKINDTSPDILWVGLSAPKQEKFIYNNFNKLNIRMAAGIGAVFNFYSGSVKRAPLWMQKAGLEWLFRAFTEPKRLFKKYVVYNTRFLIMVFRDLLRRTGR